MDQPETLIKRFDRIRLSRVVLMMGVMAWLATTLLEWYQTMWQALHEAPVPAHGRSLAMVVLLVQLAWSAAYQRLRSEAPTDDCLLGIVRQVIQPVLIAGGIMFVHMGYIAARFSWVTGEMLYALLLGGLMTGLFATLHPAWRHPASKHDWITQVARILPALTPLLVTMMVLPLAAPLDDASIRGLADTVMLQRVRIFFLTAWVATVLAIALMLFLARRQQRRQVG